LVEIGKKGEGSFAPAFPTPLVESFLPTGKERRRKRKRRSITK
jgi:hypothetical protein